MSKQPADFLDTCRHSQQAEKNVKTPARKSRKLHRPSEHQDKQSTQADAQYINTLMESPDTHMNSLDTQTNFLDS